MRSQQVTFNGSQGHALAGILDLPTDGEARVFALFAHCFTCSKNLRAVGNISRALTEAGIGLLRFDFTGLGDSEGDFSATNFSSNVKDLVAAAGFLREHYAAPQMIMGHSLGGAAVLHAAKSIAELKAVVTIGAPSIPSHVLHHFADHTDEIEKIGRKEVSLQGRRFVFEKHFLDDVKSIDLAPSIGELNKALLVLHSPLDDTVDVSHAGRIYQAAKHPKSFVSLDNADHLLNKAEDAFYAGKLVAAWSARYLDLLPSTLKQKTPFDGIEVRTGSEGYYSEINARGHQLIADEPSHLGGMDLGPSPYDMLAASLGACTSMTLRMYADHKGLALDSIEVRVKHAKQHKEDCEHCEDKTAKIDVFEREIELRGQLTDAQRERMLEIADMCPVHKTLHTDVQVNSRLV
jgi:putative redox protein